MEESKKKMEKRWNEFRQYLNSDVSRHSDRDALDNIKNFEYSPIHTLNIQRTINDGPTTSMFMSKKVNEASIIIQEFQYKGFITTELQRGYIEDDHDFHFKVVNPNYLRHWIWISIGYNVGQQCVFFNAEIFNFGNTTSWKHAYNKILERNKFLLISKLIDWLHPFMHQDRIDERNIHSQAEHDLQTQIVDSRGDSSSSLAKRSRHTTLLFPPPFFNFRQDI